MADTIGSGNWHDPSIWSNGVVPTWDAADPNDRFARTQHHVTVTADIDVGTSPDTNTGWAINVIGGSLTFNDNLVVNLRGGFRVSGTTTTNNVYPVVFGAGINVTFDMSNATSPSTTWYYMTLGDLTGRYARITINGTANNKTTFSSTNQWIVSAPNQLTPSYHCTWDATHAVFKRLRHDPALGSGDPERGLFANNQLVPVSFVNCEFDDCDDIHPWFGGSTFTAQNCTWKNTNSTYGLKTALVAGTKTITGCVFDKAPRLDYGGLTFTGNVCSNGFPVRRSDYSTPQNATFQDNVVRTRTGNDLTEWYPYFDSYGWYCTNRITNVHLITTGAAGSAGHTVFDSIFENEPGVGSSGEVLALGNYELTAVRCITLPASDVDDTLGVIVEVDAQPTSVRNVKNCTCYRRGGNVGHNGTIPSPANSVSILDSIIWRRGTAVTGTYALSDLQGHSPDAPGPGAVDYNCTFNLLEPYQRSGTDDPFTNPPGQNDIGDVDPGFVDDTRNFLTWGASLGLVNPTHDDVWALLAKINDVDGDPNATPGNLLDWVRAGFATTNTALLGTGSDGSDIGAVPVTSQFNSTVTGSSTAGSDSVTFGWTEVTP